MGPNILKQYTNKTSSSSYINLKDTHTYKLYLVDGAFNFLMCYNIGYTCPI